MLNKWFASIGSPAVWRAALALLLSLLLHLVLLGFVHIDLSFLEPEKETVNVRFAELVKPPPVKPPEPVPEEPPLPEPPADEPPADEPAETLPEPEQADRQAVMDPESEMSPVVEPVLEDASRQPEAGDETADVPEEFQPEPAYVPNVVDADAQPFNFVESEFDILRGADGYKVGQSKVRYEARGDGTYLLVSESEAKGFASWFISGTLLQRSEGLVTEYGLQPHSFLYQYGKRNKTQQAVLDWEQGRITLETEKGSKSSRLPAGTQDLMSFMYQFMYVPPLREMLLNITNGKRLKAYSYSFVGEEDLSTKMGVMRVMHIENINDDGDEKTELWLALEYNYLPVKIRKTEEDGSVIEQVITSINTELLQ
ncbi:MAG: DUF3108 domain-containing protein [Betaproteobacteria bacterium HGW-Betaproteobacteria-1]|jgi:hypothetical protein|nr:MAG: DUF3108 domain-containing protein [Betaproteobacteria bacterium HGW-Betaproteobacteria-1]